MPIARFVFMTTEIKYVKWWFEVSCVTVGRREDNYKLS
jgi:hypothetical protein